MEQRPENGKATVRLNGGDNERSAVLVMRESGSHAPATALYQNDQSPWDWKSISRTLTPHAFQP